MLHFFKHVLFFCFSYAKIPLLFSGFNLILFDKPTYRLVSCYFAFWLRMLIRIFTSQLPEMLLLFVLASRNISVEIMNRVWFKRSEKLKPHTHAVKFVEHNVS